LVLLLIVLMFIIQLASLRKYFLFSIDFIHLNIVGKMHHYQSIVVEMIRNACFGLFIVLMRFLCAHAIHLVFPE